MSYGFKLLCLSLAAFFIVHTMAAALLALCARPAIRAAARMRARAAARLMLVLRFAPLAIASFVVVALCVPSYLWFEPDATAEAIGPLCIIAAVLSVAAWALSIARTVGAVSNSRQLQGPTIALVGVMHPKVVVSEEVRRVLSPEELDAALRHEMAHALSRDNLKRLLMLIAPDALPFWRGGFGAIESAWRTFAEWAADDEAVAGSTIRSVVLASALVTVARLGCTKQSPLVTALVDDDLSIRVERLLAPQPQRGAMFSPCAAMGAISVFALAVIAVRPGALSAVYELLERLMQ